MTKCSDCCEDFLHLSYTFYLKMVQSESENKANTMFNASGFLSAGPEKGLMGKIMTDVKNLKWSSLLQTKQRKHYLWRNFVVFFIVICRWWTMAWC